MDVWTSLSEGEQYGVWVVSSLLLLVFSLIIFPLLYVYRQRKFRTQIANHIVTTTYKLPEEMTPAELSYIFSSSIKKRHVYASLMQLVNDGILSGFVYKGMYMLKIGPRVDSKMPLVSAYTIDSVEMIDQIAPGKITHGTTSYTVPNTQEKVDGSKMYVFWWLVREGLRQRGIIVNNPLKSYANVWMRTQFKLIGCTVAATFILQLLLLVVGGDIDITSVQKFILVILLWILVTFPASFMLAFFVLKIRGRFLGRYWIMSEKKKRILNQLDAFREYVRLVQRGDAIFENDEAERRAKIKTLPYAVALGYADIPSQYLSKNNRTKEH